MPDALLQIEKLSVAFSSEHGPHEVVSDVDLSIGRGEVVALAGESGSGKTVTALSITRLLPEAPLEYVRGRVRFDGEDILPWPESRLRRLRGGRIAYVFQEPATALNPVFTIGWQIAESLRRHGKADNIPLRTSKLLESVGLPDPQRIAGAYPHQLSGGQQQRAMLAMALAGEPDLLIADEPTTALDVTVQAQILDLLRTLQQETGMAVLLITHNLAIASKLAGRIVVMYAGQVVEEGPAQEVISSPRHPYTAALLKAVPRLRGEQKPLAGIPGQVPLGSAWPAGCRFHPRCRRAKEKCAIESPSPEGNGDRHFFRCFYPESAVQPRE